jgi:RNA polymerase sigma-70 factor (ECF subfamily)
VVHPALYLLFNEGYHGASPENAVRAELCQEAMRLTTILLEHPLGATPATYALGALMCFDAARLPGRLDSSGNLSSLVEQDRSLWDQELVSEGLSLLERSAAGSELTEYHLESAIACAHSTASSVESTDWGLIVSLYDKLLALRSSPVVALNRAIAIAQRDGPERGLEELLAIEDAGRLARYPFYHAALGEFEYRSGARKKALEHFQAALSLGRSPAERRFLEQRISACEHPLPERVVGGKRK